MRLELTDREIRALRNIPAFKTALADIERLDVEAITVKTAQQDELHHECEGGMVRSGKKNVICDRCGLRVLFTSDSHRSNLKYILGEKHWKHKNGGNPAFVHGLYGKAAMAAEGDWYGSH